jgi:hypothetical protein
MPFRQNMKLSFFHFIEPFYHLEYESRPLMFYPCCFFIMRIECTVMVSSGVVDPDPSLFVRIRILASFKQKKLRKT